MSMSISICLIFSRTIIIIGCAPKIGRQLPGPLTFESNVLDDNNALYKIQNRRKYVAAKNNNIQEKPKAPCYSYDYDPTKCKYVNNRILCGYDKNLGEHEINNDIIDVGNGCRLRGERIECGYVFKPFANVRRPPAHGHASYTKHKELAMNLTSNIVRTIDGRNNTVLHKLLTKLTTKEKEVETAASTIINTVTISNKVNKLATKILPTAASTRIETVTNNTKLPEYNSTEITTNGLTYKSREKLNSNCVDKNDHIVCYDIPL